MLNQVVERNTENVEKKYKIKINNFSINFFKTLSKFERVSFLKICRKTTATHSKKFHLFVENFKTNKYETQTQKNSPPLYY